MQIRVNGSIATAAAFNMTNLTNALPVAYAQSQDKPIVPESAYNTAFKASYGNTYVGFPDTSITFTPCGFDQERHDEPDAEVNKRWF